MAKGSSSHPSPIASTIVTVAVEAVAEELSPYKELFTTVIFQQVHGAAATSCFRVSLQLPILSQMNSSAKAPNSNSNSIANMSNSIAKATNSTANWTNSIAKVTNSIAKTCIIIH